MRGGSWNNNPQNVRVSNRNRNQPTNRNNNIGFRCAGYAERGLGDAEVRGARAGFFTEIHRECQLRFRAVDPDAGIGGVKQQVDPGFLVVSGRTSARVSQDRRPMAFGCAVATCAVPSQHLFRRGEWAGRW